MKDESALIVATLLENKKTDVNIRTLANLLGKDYKVVYSIVKRLERLSVLSLKESGRSKIIELTKELHPLVFTAEFLRRERLLKKKDLRVMCDYFLTNMKSCMYIFLVFGSYAKNKNAKGSDIDLMFIVPDSAEKEVEKQILNIAETIPLKLHVHIFSESEFKLMSQTKNLTVGSEAIEHNVIIHGIESYYELIQ